MYENQIKKLYSKVNNDTNYDINGISKIITNFDVLEKTIFDDNNIKDNTKKNYLNTILNIIKSEIPNLQTGAFLHLLDQDKIEGITKNTEGWLENFRGLTVLKK